jgi:hypothetical protein
VEGFRSRRRSKSPVAACQWRRGVCPCLVFVTAAIVISDKPCWPAAKGRLGSGWVNVLRIWQLLYAPKPSPHTLKMSHSQRSQLSFAPVAHPLFHHAASKRIVRATSLAEASLTPLLLLSAADQSSHELLEGDYLVIGVPFEVDFEHVHCHNGRLHAARLS